MKCSNCQTANPEEARFCMSCGAPLKKAAEAEGRPSAGAAGLDRFIPRELQLKLEAMRTQGAPAGERRVITMLFCDVKGSTAAAEQVDPETWTEIMNGIFEHMIRPVYKYEGTVPRLMGDAILAFFGAPIAHEDDPQRAVMAALEIQQGIRPYQEEMRLRHGVEFGLRAGINTGLVVVGEIGSDLRMEYTAIGDAINLAARMEQTAAPGTVQVSEDTYRLTAAYFDFEPLGEVEVKGKSTPVRTYRPLARKHVPGQVRGLEGIRSPLVGREAQLGLLEDRLEELGRRQGAFVSIVGEAGLGKSTLVAEARKSAGPRAAWLKGEAFSYTRSTSYLPWRQLIRESIGAAEGEGAAQVRERLRYTCDCCSLPGGDIPFLEALLAVESDESLKAVGGFEGEALVQRMIDATRGFLCGLAMEQALVIVLEDLHWADEASLHLLQRLADLTGSHPIMFLCALRPDREASSWECVQEIEESLGGDYSRLELEPLPPEQTGTLLGNLLGADALPQAVRDLVLDRAGGNPFFVEELVRTLIESGTITREDGGWRMRGEAGEVAVPDNLRGVLEARIDRLPEAARRVLQNAAVIGRSFDLEVLRRLTGLGPELDAQLAHLREAGLVEAQQEGFVFRHALIQEAAYGSVLLRLGAAMHRRIAEILEEMHAGREEEYASLLAYHFHEGRDPRSLQYDMIAGEKAARLYANAEAAAHFRRALEAAHGDPAQQAEMPHLFARLGSALELSGRYEQALKNYEEMQAFGREHGEARTEFEALMAKSVLYSTYTSLHDAMQSEQALTEALALAERIGDRAIQAKLNWNLMLTYLFSSRLEQALKHGELALELARGSGDREQLAFVLNDLCRLYTCLGRFEDARRVVHEARELWVALDNRNMLADSFGSEAEAMLQSGDLDEALVLLGRALELNEEAQSLWGKAYARLLTSFVYFDRGRIGEAIQVSEQSIAEADEGGLIASSTTHRAELGWFYGWYGDSSRGHAIIDRALLLAETKQPQFRALPLALKVRLHLFEGRADLAEEAAGLALLKPISIPYARYNIFAGIANVEMALARGDHAQALELAEDLLRRMRPVTSLDIPLVLWRKADALAGLGRPEEARRVLSEARAMAEGSRSEHHLWTILLSLAKVNEMLHREEEARECRSQARAIVERIADGLAQVGLREAFLSQPRVQSLMPGALG